MAPVPQATAVERLGLIPKLVFSLAAAFKHFLLYPVTGDSETGLFRFVVYSAIRRLLSTITVAQEQSTIKPTTVVYRAIAKELHFEPAIDRLPSGLQVCWFGPKTAQKTVIFFHGGGYVLGAGPGHLKWAHVLQQALAKAGQDVNVVVPCYTLAPKGQYPVQLTEAVTFLEWMLKDQGRQPGDLMLAGDSAGGNLCLGLLGHILHPHPSISTKITLSSPLAGALLVSPWCKFSGDPSWKRNDTTDYVAEQVGKRWSALFLGSGKSDRYNEPITTDAEWWQGLQELVDGIFVWGGKGEALIDSIKPTAKILKEAHPKTELLVTPGGHETMIMDLTLGYRTKCEGELVIEAWAAKQFSRP